MVERWTILLAKPNAETVAERSLREAGYRPYLPWYRKLVMPHGRQRQPVPVMRLVFPGFIFVQAWAGFQRPLSGIEKAMSVYRGGPPATLSDEDISVMMRREREGMFDETKAPQGKLEIGAEYELEKYDRLLTGVLEELSPDGQATIRMVILGRETRVELDARELRPAVVRS